MANLPLKLDDSNEDIESLHMMLKMLNYPVNNTTNYFDTKTQRLVIAFQNDLDLKVTGIVDADTWGALEKANENKREVVSPEDNETTVTSENIITSEYTDGPIISEGFAGESVKNTQDELIDSIYPPFTSYN